MNQQMRAWAVDYHAHIEQRGTNAKIILDQEPILTHITIRKILGHTVLRAWLLPDFSPAPLRVFKIILEPGEQIYEALKEALAACRGVTAQWSKLNQLVEPLRDRADLYKAQLSDRRTALPSDFVLVWDSAMGQIEISVEVLGEKYVVNSITHPETLDVSVQDFGLANKYTTRYLEDVPQLIDQAYLRAQRNLTGDIG